MRGIKMSVVAFGLFGLIGFSQYAEAEVMESQVQNISPFATADVRKVTLANGESYTFEKKVMDIPGYNYNFAVLITAADNEAFESNIRLIEDGEITDLYSTPYYGNRLNMIAVVYPGTYLHTLTNYSSGAVTYEISLNILYFKD